MTPLAICISVEHSRGWVRVEFALVDWYSHLRCCGSVVDVGTKMGRAELLSPKTRGYPSTKSVFHDHLENHKD